MLHILFQHTALAVNHASTVSSHHALFHSYFNLISQVTLLTLLCIARRIGRLRSYAQLALRHIHQVCSIIILLAHQEWWNEHFIKS